MNLSIIPTFNWIITILVPPVSLEQDYMRKIWLYCQKLKHCSTFIVYNDAHYHIPSAIILSNRKIIRQTKMVDKLEQRQISEKQTYIKRQEREDQRGRVSYIISCISYVTYVIQS